MRAVQERGDGDFVGGVERGRRALPFRQGLHREPQRGEALEIGRLRTSSRPSAARSGAATPEAIRSG